MTLRDYQRDFVRDVQRAFAQPLPTGESTRAPAEQPSLFGGA